jgi:DNA-directed RNA polymerase subunit M/transcription elongation factor TFIIS
MDIMSPEQKDHTYCNDCWDTMLAHSFERDDDDLCAQCGEDENYRPHDIYRRKIADRMYRIAGLG